MAITLESLRDKYSPSQKVENEQKAARLESLRQKYSPSAKVEAEGKRAAEKEAAVLEAIAKNDKPTSIKTAIGDTDPRMAVSAFQKQQETAEQRKTARAAAALKDLQEQKQDTALQLNRLNRSGGAKDLEAQAQLQTRKKELSEAAQKQREVLGKQTGAQRVGKGLQSIGMNTVGSVELLGEMAKQVGKNQEAYNESGLQEAYSLATNRARLMREQYGENSREYQTANQEAEELRTEILSFKRAPDKAVSQDSRGMQMMQQAVDLKEKALEGTGGAARLLGETAISIGSNAAKLPLAMINPALPALAMGAEATAGKAYELSKRGVNASDALARGAVSGGIEAVTEQMGIDNLFDVAQTGGKTALKNILKQAGVEGTEEGFSYAFNLVADKLAKDPTAQFNLQELLTSIAGGAISGLVFGTGGTMVNRLGGGKADTSPDYAKAKVLQQEAVAQQVPKENSLHLREDAGVTDRNVGNNGQETVLQKSGQTQYNAAKEAKVLEILTDDERNREYGRKDLSDAGIQRNDGAGAREPAGELAESAGRTQTESPAQADTGGRKNEARDLADALQIVPQSPRSLGITRGTEDATMRVIPKENRTEYMTQVADRVLQQTGREVNFFVGEMRIQRSNGRGYTQANGCILPDGTIYVQADNEQWSAEQLADHEAAHELIRKNPGMMLQTIQRVQERYGNAAIDAIVEDYLRNLQGIDGVDAAYCQEEILCDAYAGMNAFDAQADVLQGDVQQSFSTYRTEAVQHEHPTMVQRGPPAEQREAWQDTAREVGKDTLPQTMAHQGRQNNVTWDEETSKVERPAEELSEAENALRGLREAYAAGEITDEEFDEAYADLMSEPEMQDRERLSITNDGRDKTVQQQVERYQRGEITEDELRGYLNGRKEANERQRPERAVESSREEYDTGRPREKSGNPDAVRAGDGDRSVGRNADRQGRDFGRRPAYQKAEGVARYSISESFSGDVQEWLDNTEQQDRVVSPGYFEIGNTSEALKSIGVRDGKIYWRKSKIGYILDQHTEIDGDVIKAVPEILEHPIAVMKSLTREDSVVMFGDVHAKDGSRVMAALELTPKVGGGAEAEFSLLTSAYGRSGGNVQNLLNNSEILYLDRDKKRTDTWLMQLGVQFPSRQPVYGSIGTIAYSGNSVNIQGETLEALGGQIAEKPKYSVTEDAASDSEQEAAAGAIKLETVAEEDHRKLLENLPGKARGYLQRVERQMVNQVAKALGVPYHAKRDALLPMVQELAVEYMNDGEISQGTKDAIFARAWDEGIEIDNDFYNAYKPLKERLRNTAIMLAEQDRGDIPDWNNARKNMFGVLKIVNKGGITVDQAYQELANDYPGMFPTDIRHPADRLQRMYEVGRDIRIANLGLEQYYGPNSERYKTFAKGEFESNLGETLRELQNIKRVADEQAEKAQVKVPETPADIMSLYQQMKDARREYEKVNAKQLLSDSDKELLNRAMRGEVDLDNIRDDGRYNLQGVKTVYEVKQKYEQYARTIRQYNNQRKAGLRNSADEFLKNAGSWKDKKAGILYARETMERNIRDIVKDKSEAGAVIREYFAPVHRNEAAATRMKDELRERVNDLGLSQEVQEGNLISEAQAVKTLRTAEKNIQILKGKKGQSEKDGKNLKEWEEAVAELWKQNPKLNEAEIRNKMNSSGLSRTARKGDLVSESHAVQLLGEAEDNIRMLQNNKRLKVRDGKTLQEWQAIVNNIWEESPSLDQAKIRKSVETFREIYDQLFKQMNEVRVRNGYEPINFRSGYFPHFQAETDGILAAFGKALGIDTAVNALPTSINGLTRNFKPGIRWVGNTLERIGFQTTYDAVEGFDRYIEGVADVIHHTDDIQKLRALASQIRYRTTDDGIRERVDDIRADSTLAEQDKELRIQEIYASGRFELGNFVVNLDEYTNLLANKKSESDRNMERMMGRRMYSLMKSLESRVAANMVALNPASWLTNFIPITQGGAQLGSTTVLKGMWNTLRSFKVDDGIVARSSFLTNRQGSEAIVQSRSEQWAARLSAPMGWIDNFTAGSLVRARYEQNLKRGMSEDAALEEADEWTAGVMADRSKGSMPTLFYASNPLTKLFTQFQLEVNNQLSYLFKDLPKEQLEKGMAHLITALLKFFVGAWLYNEVYEYFIGRRPALDPIGILNEVSGDLTGWELPNLVELGAGAASGDMPSFQTEKEDAYNAVSGLLGNVAEELPFIGGLLGGGRVPIQSALPDAENLGKVLLSDDWSTEKKWATFGKEMLKPAAYLVPSVGGGQMKRAVEGVKAWWDGGSYTVNAQGERQMQYPIFNDSFLQSAANLARVVTFGKTTLPVGREWIENDFKTFSVNETAAYEAMVEVGLDGEEAYNTLLAMRAAKKTETESADKHKQRVLLESEISGEAKALAYYFMFASDEERVMLDDLMDQDANVAGTAEVLMQFKVCESSNEKRSVLIESDLNDWEKRVLYREKISDSREEEINMFKAAGLDMDDFLRVQNQYTLINEDDSSAAEKATALSRWINKQRFSAGQKETIKEAFKYYSQIPAAAAQYDKFTGVGLTDDEAYRLTEELNGLQPAEGKKNVSNLQKWQAVMGVGLSADKQMAALEKVMTEAEYGKLLIGKDYGIEPDVYVQFKVNLEKYDANGNGSYSQSEIKTAIDAMAGDDEEAALLAALLGDTSAIVLTNAQKAVLWQLQSGSTSAKNNPYSVEVGTAVLLLKNGESDEDSAAMAELEALLGGS